MRMSGCGNILRTATGCRLMQYTLMGLFQEGGIFHEIVKKTDA